MFYRIIKKSNEDLYESNIRSDFSPTKKICIGLLLDSYCFLRKNYFYTQGKIKYE